MSKQIRYMPLRGPQMSEIGLLIFVVLMVLILVGFAAAMVWAYLSRIA